MKHFILTKLNLKWSDRELTEDYMKYRIVLFEISAYSSIKNQTSKDFQHIIFSDPNIPDDHKKMLEERFPESLVIYTTFNKGREVDNSDASYIIREMYPNGRIITTNLDSDDCLREDYVETINKLSNDIPDSELPSLLISPKFYNYSIEKGMNLVKVPFSPSTMSLIENDKKIKTCWCRGHSHLVEEVSTIKSIDMPFLVLTHPTNICTRYFNNMIIEKNCKNVFERFGVYESSINRFLSMKLPEQFIKEEEQIRNNRRLRISSNKPSITEY